MFATTLDRAMHLCNCAASGLQLFNAAGTHLVLAHAGGGYEGAFQTGDTFPLNSALGVKFCASQMMIRAWWKVSRCKRSSR